MFVQIDLGHEGAYVCKLTQDTRGQKARVLACTRYPSQRAELYTDIISPRYPLEEGTEKYAEEVKPYAYTTVPSWRDSVAAALKKAMLAAKAAGDEPVYEELLKHRRELAKEMLICR